MKKYENVIKAISLVNYSISNNCSVGCKNRIIHFFEDAYNIILPNDIKDLLLNNHFTQDYLNYLIRKSKINNAKIEPIYSLMKESCNLAYKCGIRCESENISISTQREQINYAGNSGFVTGLFIRGILNILNILEYNDFDEGVNDLIKCAEWNNYDAMLALSNIYFVEDDYKNAYYFILLLEKLNSSYITNEILLKKENISKKLSKEDIIDLQSKVFDDYKIHNILNDNRLGKMHSKNKLNNNILNIMYSKVLSINEIERIMFNNGNVNYNAINTIINSYKINEYKLIANYLSYGNIFDEINSMIKKDLNNPLIISVKNESLELLLNNYLNNNMKDYYVENVNCDLILNKRFGNRANEDDIFYRGLINTKLNKFILILDNLNKSNACLVEEFININKKYYYDDLDMSFSKNKMLTIIITTNVSKIPNRIVEMSKLIEIDKLSEVENKKIIREYIEFICKEENINLENINDIIEYLNNIQNGQLSVTIKKLINNSISQKKILEEVKKESNKHIGFV